jgi:hypothetical protein
VEQHRHIQDVRGREREIAAEQAHFGVGEAIESSSECTASMVPRCMAWNSSPVGTIWSAKNSSISISPLAGVVEVDGRLGHVLAQRAPA